MPGVRIRTSTRSGPTNIIGAPTSRAFLAGITERGTLTPKVVRNIIEFQNEFGGLQSYSGHMYRAARVFFEEGGGELVVCRAVGAINSVASLVAVDRTPTTPLPTLRWDAANVGAWGTTLTVQVTQGSTPDLVNVEAWYQAERIVYLRDKASIAEIVTSLANDPYLRASDMGAASVYPVRLPAVNGAPVLLTGGADGRATVDAAGVVAALDKAGLLYGAGAVATPGYDAATTGQLLIEHCKTNRRIAILAGNLNSLPADLTAMAAELTSGGEYAGVFGPWLSIPEGSTRVDVSPEGFVLGVRARAMNSEGFWQAPAGGRSAGRLVVGTTSSFDSATIDSLAAAKVSGITTIGGRTVLYGWRSLSPNTEQYLMLNARDVLNTVTEQVEAVLQEFIFDTIDGTGQLLARVQGALVGLLQPIANAGGFAAKFDTEGNETNPAYSVSVSVLSEIALSAVVSLRLSGVAETIEVSIIKAAFNATL